NAAGSATSAVAVVKFFVQITQQPVSKSVLTNATTNLNVTALGTGTLRYQWRFNGLEITNNPSATNATLNLTNVVLTNSGNYDVVISDDVAPVPSQVAVLRIVFSPSFILVPTSSTNLLGDNLTWT